SLITIKPLYSWNTPVEASKKITGNVDILPQVTIKINMIVSHMKSEYEVTIVAGLREYVAPGMQTVRLVNPEIVDEKLVAKIGQMIDSNIKE
ncbi:MAG: hypothetical protein ACXWWA_02060, partial [Chitinophagaceae bacterium]